MFTYTSLKTLYKRYVARPRKNSANWEEQHWTALDNMSRMGHQWHYVTRDVPAANEGYVDFLAKETFDFDWMVMDNMERQHFRSKKTFKKNLLRRANSSRGEQSPFFAMVNRVLLSYLISNVNIKYQGKALNAASFFLSYPATTLHLVKRFNVRLHSHHSQGFLWGSRNEDRSRVPSHSHGATLSPTLRFWADSQADSHLKVWARPQPFKVSRERIMKCTACFEERWRALKRGNPGLPFVKRSIARPLQTAVSQLRETAGTLHHPGLEQKRLWAPQPVSRTSFKQKRAGTASSLANPM